MYEQTKISYLAFEIMDHLFAVPIGNVKRIISTSERLPYVIPPHMPRYTICVAKILNQPIAVVDLLRLLHIDSPLCDFSIIVLLDYAGKQIGLAAHNANVVSAEITDIKENDCSAIKTLSLNGTQYILLDCQSFMQAIGSI